MKKEYISTINKLLENCDDIEMLEDAEKFVSYKLKPQLKTLGPKYGAKLGLIRNFLETCEKPCKTSLFDYLTWKPLR